MSEPGEADLQELQELRQRSVLAPLPKDENGEIDLLKASGNFLAYGKKFLSIHDPEHDHHSNIAASSEAEDDNVKAKDIDTKKLYEEMARRYAAIAPKDKVPEETDETEPQPAELVPEHAQKSAEF